MSPDTGPGNPDHPGKVAAPRRPRSYQAADPADAVVALLAAARRRGPLAGTTVVAIDGPSGAGKTTLAERLGAAIRDVALARDEDGPAVLPMDDLYPGWDGLAAAVPLLVESVLRPLAQGRRSAYRRYDWPTGRYAEEHEVPPGGWLVVEGVGSGARAAAPYLSALAWVDAPRDVRLRRALARDGETYRPHWERWARQEQRHFAAELTARRADVRLDGWDRRTPDPGENVRMTGHPGMPRSAADPVGGAAPALRDAVVEMTHAQGDDVVTRLEGTVVVVRRRTDFLRVEPRDDGGLDLVLSYPAGAPDDDRLTAAADGGHLVRVAATDVDADLLALEPLIETAYAQNG